MKLSSRFRWLYCLAVAQKAIRLLVRSAWISGAVYIFCWGINTFSGQLDNPDYWLLISAAAGLISLLTLLVKPVKFSDFLWRVDRKLELQEQISTSYQVSESEKEVSFTQNELNTALLQETAILLPELIRRVLKKGWRLRNDLEALVVVVLLLATINLSGLDLFDSVVTGSEISLLPGLGSEPGFLDVFPSGIPGQSPISRTAALQAETVAGGDLVEFTPEENEKIMEALKHVGEGLLNNTATAGFGTALTKGNLSKAAKQLDLISENAGRLSTNTHLLVADQFNGLVRELYLSKYQSITDVFSAATEALENGEVEQIKRSLGEVAELLRNLNHNNHAVVDQDANTDEDAPIPRLAGEGEGVLVESAEDISDLLAVPGGGSADSVLVLGDEVNLDGVNFDSNEGTDLPSYSYSWKNNNVVSSYFTPQ
ncbi:MAG: hypothetical protein ABFS17_00265 [Chloroflexota bacterium]